MTVQCTQGVEENRCDCGKGLVSLGTWGRWPWAEAGGVLRVLSSTQVLPSRQWAGLSPEGLSREQRCCLSIHENSLRC